MLLVFDEDRIADGVDHGSQEVARGFELALGVLALADVANDRQHLLLATRLKHGETKLDVEGAAALAAMQSLGSGHVVASDDLPERVDLFRGHAVDDIVDGQFGQLLSGVAEAFDAHVIDVQQVARAVVDEDGVGSALEQLPEALLTRPDRLLGAAAGAELAMAGRP